VKTYDPTVTFDDQIDYSDSANPGWHYYNALSWSVRVDLLTNYIELNHSWYCDDKDRQKP